jgi:hypothetical protein
LGKKRADACAPSSVTIFGAARADPLPPPRQVRVRERIMKVS